jgi:hypothetical protein
MKINKPITCLNQVINCADSVTSIVFDYYALKFISIKIYNIKIAWKNLYSKHMNNNQCLATSLVECAKKASFNQPLANPNATNADMLVICRLFKDTDAHPFHGSCV